MTITWNTLLSVAAIIAAIIALWGYLTKVVHFMDRQKKQDEEIKELRQCFRYAKRTNERRPIT